MIGRRNFFFHMPISSCNLIGSNPTLSQKKSMLLSLVIYEIYKLNTSITSPLSFSERSFVSVPMRVSTVAFANDCLARSPLLRSHRAIVIRATLIYCKMPRWWRTDTANNTLTVRTVRYITTIASDSGAPSDWMEMLAGTGSTMTIGGRLRYACGCTCSNSVHTLLDQVSVSRAIRARPSARTRSGHRMHVGVRFECASNASSFAYLTRNLDKRATVTRDSDTLVEKPWVSDGSCGSGLSWRPDVSANSAKHNVSGIPCSRRTPDVTLESKVLTNLMDSSSISRATFFSLFEKSKIDFLIESKITRFVSLVLLSLEVATPRDPRRMSADI